MKKIKESFKKFKLSEKAKTVFLFVSLFFVWLIVFFFILILTKQFPERIEFKPNDGIDKCVLEIYAEDKLHCYLPPIDSPSYVPTASSSRGTNNSDSYEKHTIYTWGKPVIYLYPEKAQNVEVSLDVDGEITVTYPDYNEGWNVLAYPDGKIINSDGKEYSYLFWEGVSSEEIDYDLSKGFVVKGEDTAEFFQEKLSEIGLTSKEYNEFIVYWMPKMKDNEYNLIHFATKGEYDDYAKLEISPEPDSVLRVFIVYKPLQEKIEVEEQEIKSFERKGFSVVEWGGSEIKY